MEFMKGIDVWRWISELHFSDDRREQLDSLLTLTATSSQPDAPCIQLRPQKLAVGSELFVTVSVCLVGFAFSAGEKAVWVSGKCPLSADRPFLPLVIELLQEIVSRAPAARLRSCAPPEVPRVRPEAVEWIMGSHSSESFSGFFNLVFLTHLFWVCVCDLPSEVGSVYFRRVLAPNLETWEWVILKNMYDEGSLSVTNLGVSVSYAGESHGLWILKAYSPVNSLPCVRSWGQKRLLPDARQALLNYALAHQQLEAVIQLEYSVEFKDHFIQVKARLDNIRIHVANLGFKNDDDPLDNNKHFPSRVRVWIGPEPGAAYIGGVSLCRDMEAESEMEMHKTLKGRLGKSKTTNVKSMIRMTTRTKARSWRWDQDAEGNCAMFDAILRDINSGLEIAKLAPHEQLGISSSARGVQQAFRGLIVAGKEFGQQVVWRLNKDMEGSILKWRMGSQLYLSYLAHDTDLPYFETRSVRLVDEIDLPLIR